MGFANFAYSGTLAKFPCRPDNMTNFRDSTFRQIISALLILFSQAATKGVAADVDVNSYVNPFIGTGGHGHTYPGATVPFGLVQLSPDTGTSGWDWCSGYNQSDKKIMGFSHTHLSGTGCGDLGDILFAPTVGPVVFGKVGDNKSKTSPDYASTFSPEKENASPGFYSVRLDRDGGILVELTATERVGVHRYTFPESDKANILIDLNHGIEDIATELDLHIVGDRKLTGLRRSKGWANDQYVYFTAEFSQPFVAYGTALATATLQPGSRRATGDAVRGYVTFKTSKNQPVTAKVGLSTTSIEESEKNLKAEVPGWKFDDVKAEAAKKWRTSLSRVSVPSAPRKDLMTFYTALYHTMLAPNIISNVDGSYRGSDHQIHQEPKFATYSTFSLWDTFRAEHPLLTIVRPDLINAFITSMMHQAGDQKGVTLPIWPLYACETFCMIGYHSFPVIAEAYHKGFRDWDVTKVFDYMLKNSARNDYWAAQGYLAADDEEQSVSRTLEFAYDNAAVAQLAKDTGKDDVAKTFAQRTQFYKNVFDKSTGLARGRLASGAWRTPFNPTYSKQGNDFTEGNAWQYTFFVPQDVPGLVAELGGRVAFIKKLDQLFDQPVSDSKEAVQDVSGAIGQYAHGNEPSHHIAYLYNYVGAVEKTQQRVKQIRDTLYSSNRDGICGNEDCGQMSAWYVFSCLGFYPVNPITGEYILGVPKFSRAVLKLENGKTFEIDADPRKKYINNVLLNGHPLPRVFITHKELTNGGKLEFVMTDKPGGKWGVDCAVAPH